MCNLVCVCFNFSMSNRLNGLVFMVVVLGLARARRPCRVGTARLRARRAVPGPLPQHDVWHGTARPDNRAFRARALWCSALACPYRAGPGGTFGHVYPMYALDAYVRTYLYDDMEVPNTFGTGYGCHRAGFELGNLWHRTPSDEGLLGSGGTVAVIWRCWRYPSGTAPCA